MDKFAGNKYTMDQKLLSVGKKYYIKDENGNDLFFARMEKFKLKPKIFVYADDTQAEHILTVVPKSILDFNGTYDVIDVRANKRIGSMKREGLHSMFRNKWSILDIDGHIIGTAQEKGTMALVRRVLVNWKLDFEIEMEGWHVGSLTRAMSIRDRYVLDLSKDTEYRLDRRLAVAMLPLFDAGEDR